MVMGTWLVMLVVALVLMVWGRWLTIIDEIYSLAVYTTGVLILIFGLAMAPGHIPILLGTVTLGWLQLRFSRL